MFIGSRHRRINRKLRSKVQYDPQDCELAPRILILPKDVCIHTMFADNAVSAALSVVGRPRSHLRPISCEEESDHA